MSYLNEKGIAINQYEKWGSHLAVITKNVGGGVRCFFLSFYSEYHF